ncbi:NAD(P)H-hydrate epimerase [Penicillium maclennaniae]|uniref:NAD(P)H-hydrate epimerase n=1 Tax=Penicillium maclennaniae TaxID=1343394 RepID=UPI0025424945|nr:NAD(P)H-hydrate epimerase [Penicillium maclennaniae]KAJ5677738.1 NAD(P)H-hydrate epimerase [Penicillium maclennaniae]
MASEFIGCNVLVSLRTPPGGKLQGQVADVIGQNLLLHNVTLLWNGQRLPHYSLDASIIMDLSLESTNSARLQHPQPQKVPATRPQQHFIDPAILSFSKTPSEIDQAPAPRPLVQHAPPLAASLTEPFSDLELNVESTRAGVHGASQEMELQGSQNVTPTKQTSRRNRRGNDDGFATKHGSTASTNPKSKGWRQTAFVEPAVPATKISPEQMMQSGAKLRKRKTRRAYVEDPSGWATEDATDIQELGEFDFESNLSKFDKRRVFEEIRNDDTTADEARLVSFNRKVKPGTNGGKNLHWTENVLDSPQNSDTGDDEVISDTRLSSENISGRERSRASRLQTSRKSSTILGQANRPQINVIGRTQLNTSRTTSPHPGRSSVSPMIGPNVSSASLRLSTTNRSCPTVSPLQTLEVEQIAVAEFGLSEDIITENAGRGIAEAAVGLLSDDAAAPTILIITGNHRTGARAISAARHLRNRGHRVTVCLLGLEHEAELLENCRKQLEIFRKIGGRVLRWEDLSTRLSTSELAPDLVIDSLFGMHVAFDDLRTDDQAVAFEMISWVNRSNVHVLSVDVPSGMSASSGEASIVDGGRLCINTSSVVCLGAPKTGILSALLAGEGHSWKVTVADIGIPQIVWRKYGTRRRHGIDFGNRWVVSLRLQTLAA